MKFILSFFFSADQCQCGTDGSTTPGPTFRYNAKHIQTDKSGRTFIALVCWNLKCSYLIPAYFISETVRSVAEKETPWAQMCLACIGGLEYSNFTYGSLHQPSESTFTRYTKRIWSIIPDVAHAEFKEQRDWVITRNIKDICLQLDGAWATRGWTSSDHTFVLRDAKRNKVYWVSAIQKTKAANGKDIVKGNHDGTSQTMEARGLQLCLEGLEPNFLKNVAIIVTDGDVKLPLALKQTMETFDIKHAKDGNHLVKNWIKKVEAVIGSRYGKIFLRMKNFLLRILQRLFHEIRSDDMVQDYENRVKVIGVAIAIMHKHYTERPCPDDCLCRPSTTIQSLFDRIAKPAESSESVLRRTFLIPPPTHVYSNASSSMSAMEASLLTDESTEQETPKGTAPTPAIARALTRNKTVLTAFHAFHKAGSTLNTGLPGAQTSNTANEKPYIVFTHKCNKSCKDGCKPAHKFQQEQKKLHDLFEDLCSAIIPALWGLSTSLVEGSHSKRAKFVDKTLYYYTSFSGRTHLSAYLENVSKATAIDAIWKALKEKTPNDDIPSDPPQSLVKKLSALDRKSELDARRKGSLEYKMNEARRAQETKMRREIEKQHILGLESYRKDPVMREKATTSTAKATVEAGPVRAPKKRQRAVNTMDPDSEEEKLAPPRKQRAATMDESDSSSDSEAKVDCMEVESDEPSERGMESELSDGDFLEESFDELVENDLSCSETRRMRDHQNDLSKTWSELSWGASTEHIDTKQGRVEMKSELETLGQNLTQAGLTLDQTSVGATSDSFFRSLVAMAESWTDDERTAVLKITGRLSSAKLRHSVVSYLERYPDTLHTVEDDFGQITQPISFWTERRGFRDWLESVAVTSTHAEDLLVTAAANAFNMVLHVYFGEFKDTTAPNPQLGDQPKEVSIAYSLSQRRFYPTSRI